MSLIQNIFQAQYRVLRAPATFVERNLIARLPQESVLRLGAEGGLGVMDSVVGRITGNDSVRRRGTAMIGEAKALLLARWDDRHAQQLRHRAESQRSRSYVHAHKAEDRAHDEAVKTLDSTLTSTVEAKAGVAMAAADRAAARAKDVAVTATRRMEAADRDPGQSAREADAGRHEAEFWLGVADSNRH